jgi:serine/threonine protein kinase
LNSLANDLQSGFSILWYKIESVLGRGGFGITYLATDTNLDQLVAIKEYLPNDFATRSSDSTVQPVSREQENMYSWGLERFMSEAQTLAKFRHPNIVRVLSVFKQNNTGYMVMEYEHGRPLYDIYKEKKRLSQKALEAVYYPIVDGLAAVHQQGFIHRDIKPGNIYIRKDGSPVLLDFGAARQAVGTHSRTLTSMLTVGYAPFEQYHEGSGKQGPWTDVYALCACLFEGIKGHKPMDSAQRGMALLHNESDPYNPLSTQKIIGYEYAFLRGIDQGLMIQIHDRPQSLESLMGMLKGDILLQKLPFLSEPATPAHIDKTVIRPISRPFVGKTVNKDENSIQPQQVSDNGCVIPIRENSINPRHNSEAKVQSESTAGSSKKWALVSLQILMLLGLLVTLIVLLRISDDQSPAINDITSNSTPVVVDKNTKQQKIRRLLKQADDFYQSNNYINSGSENALNRYLQLRSLDSQNKTAITRLNSIAIILLNQADELIKFNRVSDAAARLDAVSLINPEFPGLSRSQKKLKESVQIVKAKQQLEMLLDQGRKTTARNHLYKPVEGSSLEIYLAVLAIDPENSTAKTSLKNISKQIINDAHSAMDNKQYGKAQELVSLVEQIDPETTALKEMKNKLLEWDKLNRMIARADAAYNEQRYTSPSSGSAVNLYREVLVKFPTNEHAKKRLADIAERYAKTIRKAINSKNLKLAEYDFEILRKHFPEFKYIRSLENDVKKLKSSISIGQLIPVGINQSQDDGIVVEDIVSLFVRNFKNRNLQQLKQVAQLTKDQESLYKNLFSIYQYLDLKLEPQSFTINRARGMAVANFQISDLVDKKGRTVTTTANWTRLSLHIQKKEGSWLKIEITHINKK